MSNVIGELQISVPPPLSFPVNLSRVLVDFMFFLNVFLAMPGNVGAEARVLGLECFV